MKPLEFRQKREDMGLTQEELGSELATCRRQIIAYEKGDVPVPDAKARLLTVLHRASMRPDDPPE